MKAVAFGAIGGMIIVLLMYVGALFDRWNRRRAYEKQTREAIKRWAKICNIEEREGETQADLRRRIIRAMSGMRGDDAY